MGIGKFFQIIGKNVFGIGTGKAMYRGSGVDNFGKVSNNIYRGSRPNVHDYGFLKNELGIKTVLDLTNDPESWCAPTAAHLQMGYINVPMSDKDYPSDETVRAIEKVILDESTYPLFIHCNGGRHRTGVVVAMYRLLKYNWPMKQVYSEMKDFDFYTEFGHGDMKKYIYDYADSVKNPTKN